MFLTGDNDYFYSTVILFILKVNPLKKKTGSFLFYYYDPFLSLEACYHTMVSIMLEQYCYKVHVYKSSLMDRFSKYKYMFLTYDSYNSVRGIVLHVVSCFIYPQRPSFELILYLSCFI